MSTQITINIQVSEKKIWKFWYFKKRNHCGVNRPDGTMSEGKVDSLDQFFEVIKMNLPDLIDEFEWGNAKKQIETNDSDEGGDIHFDFRY